MKPLFSLNLEKLYSPPQSYLMRIYARIQVVRLRASTHDYDGFVVEKTGRLAVTNNAIGKRSLLQELAQRVRAYVQDPVIVGLRNFQ